MEKAKEKIRLFVEGLLEEKPELFLIDIVIKGNTGSSKVLVILDGDNGISIDDCIKVSRKLSSYLEENDPIEGKYTLEVTSAGLDHPLQSVRQYVKNIGRQVKVTDKQGNTFEGELSAASADEITLKVLKDKKKKITEEKVLSLAEIEKTNVLVSFK